MSLYQEMASRVISTAHRFIGQKEIPDNKGFYDDNFDSKMDSVGFKVPHPWCAYFVEMVYKEALSNKYPDHWTKLKKLLTPGALLTMNNLNKAGYKLKKDPKPGDIVVWQSGTSTRGHIGIVVGVNGKNIKTIEGNTNAAGSREGGVVAKKDRRNLIRPKNKGLHIRGYISPYPEPEDDEEIDFVEQDYKTEVVDTDDQIDDSVDYSASFDDNSAQEQEGNVSDVFGELNEYLLTGKDISDSVPDKKEGEKTKAQDKEKTIKTIVSAEHPQDVILINSGDET